MKAVVRTRIGKSQTNKRACWIVAAIFLFLLAGASCSVTSENPQRVFIPGTLNLRDIGGYPTLDGRTIKQGQVYRSDQLTDLNRDGLKQMRSLGLKRVYDLRNDKEKQADPYTLNYPNAPQIDRLPVYHESQDPDFIRHKILSGDVKKGEFEQLMIDTYRTLVLDYCPTWAELLKGLADPRYLPALIHCTHGKDRTGFSIALVLLTLGVAQETVMADYMLSNRYLKAKAAWYSLLAHVASFFRTPRDEVRALLEVRPAYLDTAIETIQQHYGTLEAYLRNCLKIEDAIIVRLRERLLEASPGQ
jgi:protein-tyrosine phosphatase